MTNSNSSVDQPLVSVIIPAFNRATLIGETLDSIIAQSYTHWECIIVDDGSKDNTIQVIEEYCVQDKRFTLYKRDREPKGPSTCRNIGLANSSGQFLIFIDSDDLLSAFCFEQRVNLMIDEKELDFAVFNMEMFHNKPGDFGRDFNLYKENTIEYINSFLKLDTPWGTPCPIWRRDFFVKSDGFNEDFLIKTDPELHTRILLKYNPKFLVKKDSKPDYFYRAHMEGKPTNFTYVSIYYRIKFLQHNWDLLKQLFNTQIPRHYTLSLKEGVSKLFSSHLIYVIK